MNAGLALERVTERNTGRRRGGNVLPLVARGPPELQGFHETSKGPEVSNVAEVAPEHHRPEPLGALGLGEETPPRMSIAHLNRFMP